MNLQKEYAVILSMSVALLIAFVILSLIFLFDGNFFGFTVLIPLNFLTYQSSVKIYYRLTSYTRYFYPLIVYLSIVLFGGLLTRTTLPVFSFPFLSIAFGILVLLWAAMSYSKLIKK